jgi:glutathione synthase/RimK-type ligase-like ATP-grasp enzyme
MFIYGYNFPNNNAAAEKICNDKSGLSNILEYKNIPTFKYYFFMNKYFEFSEIKKIFNQNNNDVVIKPNNGTAGNDVYRCKTLASLKKYVDFIDTHYASFVVSKFYNYENEYRVIIYNQEIFTIYKKQRQGD